MSSEDIVWEATESIMKHCEIYGAPAKKMVEAILREAVDNARNLRSGEIEALEKTNEELEEKLRLEIESSDKRYHKIMELKSRLNQANI